MAAASYTGKRGKVELAVLVLVDRESTPPLHGKCHSVFT